MTTTSEVQKALGEYYRVERDIGAGGMATVYFAHDPKHDRKVAIKVLRPELAAIVGGDASSRRSAPPRTCSTRTSSRCTTRATRTG